MKTLIRHSLPISAAIALSTLLGGCGDQPKAADLKMPPLAPTAQRYNQRVGEVSRLWARATVDVRYTDDDGERRFEQGEGHLRIEMPSHVALSAGKVGQTLFWLGCDARRYWWFDLTGKQGIAFVGEHFGPGRGKGGLAAVVSPRELPRLLGLTPMPRERCEMTPSSDGKLIGVTMLVDGGTERRWLDPETLEPRKIEIWDSDRKPVLVADLSEYTNLELTEGGGAGPRVPTQVFIGHTPSSTVVRLYLSAASDGGKNWDPGAFEFDRLIGSLGVGKVTNLDAPEGQSGKKSY